MTSSPLNPATSAPTNASDIEGTGQTSPDTKANHPGTVDLTSIVPALRKSDLPNSATPGSGEEADIDA